MVAVLVAALFIVYALVSRRLERSSLTGPMIFTAAGLLFAAAAIVTGTAAENLALDIRSEPVQRLLEATLVIILFSDAVLIDARAVRKEAFLPGRLLGIGLPLTIVAGTLVAMAMVPELGFWPAAVIAVVLAPTDAALGQAVVANENVPGLVRQGLGVESGLNDGIAVPFLTIAIAGAANEMGTAVEIVTVFVEEIGYAVLVGIAVGWLGARAVRYAYANGWMTRGWRQVSVAFLAVLCFLVADQIGGSGFIAAFVGGLVFGAGVRDEYPDIGNFSEGLGHLLTMFAFFVFGALILAPAIDFVTWRIVVYAVLSLTVIRIVPVAISLIGTGLAWPTKLYVGWFGPRGLASLVFLGTVVVEAAPEHSGTIIAVGAVTVGLSVVAHGITAWPASKRYAAWYSTTATERDVTEIPEGREVEHIPAPQLEGRLRHLT